MTRDELALMLDAYRDGDIAQADAEHLAKVIRDGGDESAWVIEQLETGGFIAQAVDGTDGEAFLRGFWERQRAEQDSEHFVHDFEVQRVRKTVRCGRCYQIPRSPLKRYADCLRDPWIALAASMVLLLAAAISYWRDSKLASAIHVEQVRGEVFVIHDSEERAVRSDTPLLSGDGLRVSGEESAATLVFADGTRLEFGEDTVVTCVTEKKSAGKRVVLSEGFFTAQVAKQPAGKPMILATPNSEVVVLGTTFSLSVGTAVTHLATQSGHVRLKRTGDGRSVEVPAGFDATVATVGEPLVAQPLAPRTTAARLQLEGCWTGALSPEGDALVATRYVKGDLEIWDIAASRKQSAFRAHDKRVTAAAFTPDGQTLITGSLDGTLKWWNRTTGALQATLSPNLGEITDLRPSRDGRALTVLSHEEGSETRTMSSWDAHTRQKRWGPKPFLADRLIFSPDGEMLATARKQERWVTLWDLDSGEVKTVLRESGSRSSGLLRNVFSMAFSHDGRTLAVDDMSGLVSLWDVATGDVRTRFQRQGGRIFGMGFSPDDRLLATGQQDDTIRIWDIASAAPIAAFAGQSRTHARDVTFASDGRMLLTCGIRLATTDRPRDGALQLWELPASITQPK